MEEERRWPGTGRRGEPGSDLEVAHYEMRTLLESGIALIVDRYAYFGVSFTAAKEGFTIDWCKNTDRDLPQHDLGLYLHLTSEAAAMLGTFGKERYEKTDMQLRVAKNFQLLKDSYWQDINAEKTEDDLEIRDIVFNFIPTVKDKPMLKLWEDK
ncbi:thymidylate kinase-like [Crassostrea virginica]